MNYVVYSGGMDSFTLLHYVKHQIEAQGRSVPANLQAISFNYGQRHKRELEFAAAECSRLGIQHTIIELGAITPLLAGSALTTDMPVPEGHYAEETMRKTVVPGRNTFMLALAMAFAEGGVFKDRAIAELTSGRRTGAHAVWYGAHAGDHHIYPDCRPGFVSAMQNVYNQATDGMVSLNAPFLHIDKLGILRRGQGLGLTAADYGRTWTCYKGGEHACGVCGSCNERAEAFAAMGWADPAMAWKEAPAA